MRKASEHESRMRLLLARRFALRFADVLKVRSKDR
jgi:hypothetical protein